LPRKQQQHEVTVLLLAQTNWKSGVITVTVKSQVAMLLQQSVATQCTLVVVPGANTTPEAGLQTTPTFVQQRLLAVTV
jgi:hypothetical protein